MHDMDENYYRRRAAQERCQAQSTADPRASRAHARLAELHERAAAERRAMHSFMSEPDFSFAQGFMRLASR